MKSILAAGALLAISAPAYAGGAYVNVENNAAFIGGDYEAAVTDLHVGYEWDNGIYVQAGPAFIDVDGEGLSTEYSGKLGTEFAAGENVSIYGELSLITDGQSFDEDLRLGTQVGVTYRF